MILHILPTEINGRIRAPTGRLVGDVAPEHYCYWRPSTYYMASLNLKLKVLDFVKSGGPTCTELSLSQNDVRWQAYSDAKYYADDGVRDSCQWPQVTRHDKVPDRQVEG